MSSSILKYGQVIRICSNQAANANPLITNTFITSKSYTDQNLYFQVYNFDDKYLNDTANQALNIQNYRQSLFEVLPTSSFEINDQMNSMKTQAKKKQSAPRAKTQQEQFKAIIAQKRGKYISFGDKVVFKHLDSQYYMYGSFDCALSGIGAFKIELRKQLSQKIIFQLMSYRTYEKSGDQMSINAPFRIYHCQTQCYVSYCFQNIFIDKNFNQQKFTVIESPKVKSYQFIEDQYNRRNVQQQQGLTNSKAQIQFPNAGRFLIINQNIPKRVFKLVVHNEFEMKINKSNIKNHDIVYFIHTKDDKYLCCDNFAPKTFLKKRKNQSDLTHIFDGLWEIQEIKTMQEKHQKHDDLSNLGKSRTPNPKKIGGLLGNLMNHREMGLGQSYLAQTVVPSLVTGALGAGFVSIDQEETSKTGAKKKQKYVIRHLISGRVMFISQNKIEVIVQRPDNNRYGVKKPVLLQSVDAGLADGALVQFAYKTTQGDSVQKKFIKYFLDIKQQKSNQKPIVQNQMQEQEEQEYINQENSQILQQNLDQIQATYESFFQIDQLQMTTDSSEHGFRIYKIDEQIKQLTLFVLSSQEVIFKFSQSLAYSRYPDEFIETINVQILNSVINVLKGLIGFIYDCQYNVIAQSGNNPNSKKQRIFDELGMIELITRLVQIIDIQDKDKTHLPSIIEDPYLKQSQYKKVRYIYVLSYELLESIAANNYQMKIKISKYLEKYLEQILRQPNKIVYKSIQEVLDGNFLALSKKVDFDYIEKLIDSFQVKNPDPADLYFLSRLCLCKQDTVVQNQIAVYQSFYKKNQQEKKEQRRQQRRGKSFQDERVADNKFKFRQDQGKMQILSRISSGYQPQFRTLTELYEQCEMSSAEGVVDPEKGHWNYFLQYLNLLADVCVHRNSIPLAYISDNLPLKTLVAFLHQSTVKKKLLFQPFIRLVHHAFVQNKKFQQINRITKVKEWNALGDFKIPKSLKLIQPDLQKTMTLIMDYIRRINKFQFQMPDTSKKQTSILDKKDERQPQTIDFDPQDKNRLINVKTFLQILKSTLNLGFWPSIEIMKKMVPYMLKVLKFDIEYSNKKLLIKKEIDKKKGQNQHLSDKEYRQLVYAMIKQELTLNKPTIVMLVECKILAAQIMNIIIDYEYNVRVSIITKYFKDVMQMDVDLSKYKFDKMEFIKKWKNNQEYDLFQPTNDKQGYLLNQDLWKDKVNQIIEQRDIFSLCHAEGIDKSLVMFQAFVYSNQALTNITFQIMNRISNERRQILKTFKDIIFVAGGNLSKLADRGVKVTRSVLLHLTNNQVKNATIAKSPNYLWEVVRTDGREVLLNDSKQLGAIQQLAFLTMAMMKKGNPTLQRASRFYRDDQLYPFRELMKGYTEQVDSMVDGSYLVITQKDQNLPLNQNLIKSQDHHLLIIDFIKIMSDIKDDEDKEEIKPLPRRALHAAYNFLTVLVWNHNENKKQLEDLLRISQSHLNFNMGTIDFYKEMYKNNKKLVKKSQITGIVHHIIDLANRTSLELYQKSKLLDFLRIIVIFDDMGYDINQNMVMEIISQYQVSSNNQIVILNTQDELSKRIKDSFEFLIATYMDLYNVSIRTYIDLNISPQLFYIATFFQIFSALIENQNVVNIGKCTNMHPINFLHKYLEQAKYCWPIVRHLRAYLNKLYYFNGREKDTTMFESFVLNDLRIIKNQLRGISQLVCNTPQYNILRIKNPIRYTYLGSYVFLTLEEILHSLDLMFQNKDFSSHMAMLMSQITINQPKVPHTILQIIQMIEYLQKTIDGRYINKYLAKVSKQLKKNVANVHITIVDKFNELSKKQMNQNLKQNNFGGDDVPFKKNYVFHQDKGFWRHLIDWNSFKEQQIQRDKTMNAIQKGIVKDPSESKEAQLQKKRDYMLDYIYLGNIQKKIQKPKAEKRFQEETQVQQVKNQQQILAETNLPKNLTTSMSNRFRVKNQRFQNTEMKNTVINTRRKKLVKFLQINEQFRKFSLDETQTKLYNVFSNLNEISKNKYQSIVVGNADVIKSIVKMNEADATSINQQYKLMVINLLTNYIQRESKIFQKNIQDWFLSEKQVEPVRNSQDFLNQCGCASFLCSLITNDLRSSSIQMGNQILLLGVVLLLGQNKANQDAIFKYLKQDEKNVLLNEIYQLIRGCGISIANHVFGGSQKQISSKVNFSDTFDFFNDNQKIMTRKFIYIPQTVEQQKQFDQKLISLQYAFIFLRVLCQGNNQIKNFIREQTTNDQQKRVKNQSINFITLGVSQTKRMFSKFNINIVKVPFSIIDFIIQVTQIPCIENQLFLCQSTFFHDFANLQVQIENQLNQNVIPQNDIANIAIINKIYSLCVKNAISCLEGNMEQIYSLLSSQDLCRFFVKCFSFYVKKLPLLQNLGGQKIQTYKDLQNLLKKNKHHQNFYLDLFQVTSVIIKLKHKTPNQSFSKKIQYYLNKTVMKEYFQLIQKNLLGIQITMDQNQLSTDRNQILFFPKHAVFNYLSRSTREVIMQQINRSTQRDKIIGLFATTNEISSQIDYNYVLDNQFKVMNVPVSISNTKITFYQNLGMYMATFICFVMILFSDVVYYPYDHVIEYDQGRETILLMFLSYLQFLIAVVFYLLWTKNHLHLAIGKYQQDLKTMEEQGQSESTLLKLIFKIPFSKNFYCLLNYDKQFSGILLYMLGSTLGTFYKMQWFSLLLFNLMMKQMDVLKNILAAITTNMKMLGMLSLLGTAFIAIFSIFGIHFYANALYPDQIPKVHCQSVLDCIIELYISEQIGQDMEAYQNGRFIYDMIYTVFMDMLFGNIVGGVLIDTFAQLRDTRNQIQEDKKGKCFICGIERETLQKKNEDLKTHYKYQYHKLWNYVFYLYYLQRQLKKTGLQIIIQNKIKSQDVSWIPNSAGEEGDIGEKIQQLKKLVMEQAQTIKSIESHQ